MGKKRLLFASIHSYLDPSSGAAMASREVLELLTARGWDCRALTCGVLDYQRETALDEALATMELPAERAGAGLSRGGSAEVIDLDVGGVRVTLMPTTSSRAEKSPNPREGAIFLDLANQVFERFQPQVLLTYGGHPVSLELMRRARAKGIAVVFHLHNEERCIRTANARYCLRAGRGGGVDTTFFIRGHHTQLLTAGRGLDRASSWLD